MILEDKDFFFTKEEGNKIIAEFMGWTLKIYPTHMKSIFHGRSVWWSPGTTKSFCCEEGQEHFHDSWEWLMTVVDEIQKQGVRFKFFSHEESIHCEFEDLSIPGKSIVEVKSLVSNIRAVYMLVIFYILNYKTQVKSEQGM